MSDDSRPNPEALLSRLQAEETRSGKGRLKIFFGAIAGVGKTYSMLQAAQQLKDELDIVVGYVETHGRRETEALLEGLERLPESIVEYKNTKLREFNIDAALLRKPKLILVDELAHTNAPGSRHTKRWQDVQELLEAGIDVYTTMNVQHVESLHDIVAQITKVSIRERVPDSLLEKAHEIELVDLPPDELLERLKDGKVYMPEQAKAAMENFFRKGNLIALRELVLRYTAERVVADMEAYRQVHDIQHPWPAAERILVCVSPSPLSSRLVRSGKRMAEALRARFTVLYVEGTRQIPLPESDKNRVIQTLRLADQLGADTLELSGANISEEIIKCAKQYNVSKIVIGKPARPRWRELVFGSVVDDVIRLSGAIDVYVITGDEGQQLPQSQKMMINRTSKFTAYAGALALVVVITCFARLVLLPYFELTNIVMVYLLAVVFIAAKFGRGPSILSSVSSVAAFDFFCVPPYLTFAVSDTQYVVTFAVMLVVALVISTLTVTTKQQAEAARLREMRTAALYSMSRELASKLDMKTLAEIGVAHIANVFDSQVAFFLADLDGNLIELETIDGKICLKDLEIGVAAWVHQNKQAAGLGTDTLPGAGELYLPLMGAEKNLGVLAVRPRQEDRFISPEQLRLLETFANQTALALERARLSEESEQARLQIKTEQLRSSLLSSVSHDLRTPLATIAGTATSIIEASDALNLEACKQLVKDIYEETLRMNRLVGNLLDMTKLQTGTLQLARELEAVEEIIGAAASYEEDKIGNHKITTKLPNELLFVSADALLIQQVLVNLIENAGKYSPEGTEIEIAVEASADFVCLSVADRGRGVKDEHKERIFEKFFREDADGSVGAGLGLSICAGIVEAHGGKIWVEDRAGGGSVFKFTLPRAAAPTPLDLEEGAQEVASDG